MSLLLISQAYSFSDDENEEIVASKSKTKENCNAYQSFENTAKTVKKFKGKNKLRHRIAKQSPSRFQSTIPQEAKSVFKFAEKEIVVFTSSFMDLPNQMENESFQKMHYLKEKPRKRKNLAANQCIMCFKKFVRSHFLETHILTHIGEKPFSCSNCCKSFADSINLKRHQRIHSGEKPFQCSVCRSSFNRQDSLRKHQQIHTGERPYQCTICCKRFALLKNLRAHERVHTKEKPFECLLCGKRFTWRNTYKRHTQSHNKIEN